MGDAKPPSLKRRRLDSASIANPPDTSWRNAICEALGLDNTIADGMLQEALDELRGREDSCDAINEGIGLPETEPHYKNLYRIHCAKGTTPGSFNTYEDSPITKSTDGKDIHLTANELVTDFDRYIQRNPGISFAVIHQFICCKRESGNHAPNPLGPTREWGESLLLASEDLYTALLKLNTDDTPPKLIPAFAIGQESLRWDFWAFHNLPRLQTLPSLCDGMEKKHASVFSEYFCVSKAPAFKSIENLISSGYTTRQSLGYLFIPGDVMVHKSPRGGAYDTCYELIDWPTYHDQWAPAVNTSDPSLQGVATQMNSNFSWWDFDGNFMKITSKGTYKITITAEGMPIASLPIVPYYCLAAEKQKALLRRGRTHWKCRKMRYVSYEGWDFERLEHHTNIRFMIDPELSKMFYRRNEKQPEQPNPELTDDLGPEAIEQPEPPSVNFSLTAPNFAWGFNMQDKKWKKLAIDHVSDVDWDDKAFDNLVIDPDSKDVIQALVTNKIQNSISTDLVRGKGSGLILLLHGPPGTGKTLTAESVAEHARKPLYRVACGDIGTKPEAVEQYLKRVLSLGKSWDCVVLLDEAEVFLQERSLEDMERNALVSVFLRNLEYYDGILILTSNRVGTFDEGFRSRIQLAIHYPKLEQASRRRVWENFVNRLNDDPIASGDIDIRNLRSNLTELSRFDLNGREIRNAINVARPLARSEGRKVDFDSLKKVVKVQQKFYEYMKDMNEGLDDEKVAREEGKR
ncbi:hypothetical protein EKO27_g4984 [Xylaria grammica]|uniref:AAA+ ATPase domain-containing protein n=1 Tax=Xylaria grammica TaxID=363999 RepID=A0A439D6X2_9PEZI|nr:hypothetical protein EKO27_g4984 [Xylaria grammica]